VTSTYWHPTVVRYLEVDAQNVVFNMWYLAYFDEAMAGYLADCGYPYQELIKDGADTQLVHTELDWKGPVTWGDEVAVGVRTAATGTTSFTLEFDVRCNGVSACVGRTVYVVIATEGSGKIAIPDRLRAALS
jgi:acyl-CoA thioester hydrolase